MTTSPFGHPSREGNDHPGASRHPSKEGNDHPGASRHPSKEGNCRPVALGGAIPLLGGVPEGRGG